MNDFFRPELITDPRFRTTADGEVIPPVLPPEPPAPTIPPPVILPPPPPKRKSIISLEAARMAQGIYPREAAEKQGMIENAKAPPAPTGAWGAPK